MRALVSDGAATNRKMYKIMAKDDKDDFHWGYKPHNNLLPIYFFSNVPHLLKTTRNCMENSKWDKNTRNLHVSDYLFNNFRLFTFGLNWNYMD